MQNNYKKYFVVMILCFIIGGFVITAYVMQAYTDVWNRDFLRPLHQVRAENNSNLSNQRIRDDNSTANRLALLTSPFSLMTLISGIVLVLGGLSIWSITREKELKNTKDKITNILLLPEERAVIEQLKKSNGEMTQSQLVMKTGLSKVKIHRIVKNLEIKGIIKKYQYGLTNKILLEKGI